MTDCLPLHRLTIVLHSRLNTVQQNFHPICDHLQGDSSVPSIIDTVMAKCMTEKLYNANDFRDIAHHLDTLREEPVKEVQSFYANPAKHPHIRLLPAL
jgi:hypothetical protein